MDQVENFFIYYVLPEIVNKWLTRKPIANEDGIVQIPNLEQAAASKSTASEASEEDPEAHFYWNTSTAIYRNATV